MSKNKENKKKRTLFQRVVNIFLYAGLGLLIILLFAFGFSQTSTFRNYLKGIAVEQAESAMNANVYIGKIEGTILTSIILRNTVINMGRDTLLNAGTISVKTSPLQLLLKKIYLRSFEIRDADISLIEDRTGTLNISKLFPPSEETDTTESSFPFTIEVANLGLLNVDFSMQDYDKVNSNMTYDTLNTNDLRVKGIYLSSNASADINENDYYLEIDKFSASPNISSFNLYNLAGNFIINKNKAEVNELNIQTSRSQFSLSALANNFSVFDSTSNLNDAKLNLTLTTDSLNFADLASFIPSLDILKGNLVSKILITGNLARLNVDDMDLQYDSTKLNIKGYVRNLDNPENILIAADFYDSYINQSDINRLLPSLKVPTYPQLGLLKFDTLSYEGEPLDFAANFYLKTDKGDLAANANLNIKNPLMQYNINLRTFNFDISPFAGINSSLNSRARIKGRGTSPQNLNATINYNAAGLTIRGISLDTLLLNADAEAKNINYKLNASYDTTNISLKGLFNFNNGSPSYEINGNIANLNLADFSSDTSMNTNLNFNLNAEGRNFSLDKMDLFLSLKLMNSSVEDIKIDSTRAIVDLRSNDNGKKVINIISDLADITLTGNYSVEQTINLVSDEAAFLSNSLNKKLNEIFPADIVQAQGSSIPAGGFSKVDSSSSVEYLIDFKNFDLISLFLGDNQLEVDGELRGEINNNMDSISISLVTDIEYVKFWGKDNVFFVSNFNLDVSLANEFQASSFEDINAAVKLKTNRIFAGTDIKDINIGLNLNNSIIKLSALAKYEDFASLNLLGDVDLTGSTLNLELDKLGLAYNEYRLLNQETINVAYNQDKIDIKNFHLKRVNGSGEISINGSLSQREGQNLNISVKNLRGRDLSRKLLELEKGNLLYANINLDADITGDYAAPVMDVNIDIDSVTYKNKNFGSLKGKLNYKNKNLSADVRFIDSVRKYENPQLLITVNLPMDLRLESVEERLLSNEQVQLKLDAEDFNLAAFGNIIPQIRQLRGILTANLNINGPYDDLNPKGYIVLKDAAFIAQANNLEYYSGFKVSIDPGTLSVDSLVIENAEGTPNGGRMTGSGKANLDNLDITSSKFAINGKLKVLSEASKSASPSVYGDLVIATNGNIEFTLDENEASLVVPITITNAELTFPPTQGAYQNNISNYIYKYREDTAKKVGLELDFESLVKLSQERSNLQENKTNGMNFNYQVDVKVEENTKIVYILSKELNQTLTAVLKGNFQYVKTTGNPAARGELKLLEGSNLQFFKTLSADGSIRFEGEISNPYLDITATYTDFYADTIQQQDEVMVAVKIKIDGRLENLDENFMQEEDNIAVYYGEEAIENNEPSPLYDVSDAVLFIIAGRFVNEGTGTAASGDPLQSGATSLAGSLLGGFLNSYLGDYVRSVQLRRVGSQTRVNLTGRVNKFRYSIGGTKDIFQDLSQANVKIEYPLFESLLVRLERRESIQETSVRNEMINELGLRYKFEF